MSLKLSFENFVKSMPPSLSELKVTPSFCFAFKIPDDVTASKYINSQLWYNRCFPCVFYVLASCNANSKRL